MPACCLVAGKREDRIDLHVFLIIFPLLLSIQVAEAQTTCRRLPDGSADCDGVLIRKLPDGSYDRSDGAMTRQLPDGSTQTTPDARYRAPNTSGICIRDVYGRCANQ
jgi:hypothetical protein